MPDVETPEQVLSAAARLLEERGWCQYESEPNGPYTVDDAIELAANGDVDLAGRAIRVLAGWLICVERGPTFWMGSARQVVTRWNDGDGRDRPAVVDVLGRAAAARAEARSPMRTASPLRAAATAAGLTLLELAERAGYAAKTIYAVSGGSVAPWPELRSRVAAVLGSDPWAES